MANDQTCPQQQASFQGSDLSTTVVYNHLINMAQTQTTPSQQPTVNSLNSRRRACRRRFK